jgi:hypothetical protein
MLCDLNAMKPAEKRDHENFEPNDEVLLRCFTIPALLDSLRVGYLDTDQGAKTDIVLMWALGMHLEAEADKLADPVFDGLVAIYGTMCRERIANWWSHVSEEYRDENKPTLQQRELDLSSTLSQWRSRRPGVATPDSERVEN